MKFRPLVEHLERRTLFSVTLVSDLNTVTASSDPTPAVVSGGVGYFVATSAPYVFHLEEPDRELFRTDGTEQGTVQITHLPQVYENRNPVIVQPVAGQILFLAGTNDLSKVHLWVTDASSVGAQPLGDLPSRLYSSAAAGGSVFMVVQGPTSPELWKSNGTAAGTFKLIDIPSTGTTLTAAGSKVYFSNNALGGSEVWSSDGTIAGSVRVADIRAGTSGSAPAEITAVGNNVYFVANDNINGRELWRSDGTVANTKLVANLEPGFASAAITTLTGGTSLLYFVYKNNIWRTDGTAANTFALTTFSAAPTDGYGYSIATIADRAYFGFYSNLTPVIWQTDGTPGGTSQAFVFPDSGYSSGPRPLVAAGNRVYFHAGGVYDKEYVLDATTGVTSRIFTYPIAPTTTYDGKIVDLNGRALLPVTNYETTDAEMYTTDGTVAGTRRLKDIIAASAHPGALLDKCAVGSRAFFWSEGVDDATGHVGIWLYVSDGTSAGTRRLVQTALINGGSTHESPIVSWHGNAYFMCDANGLGRELWTSDGTVAGTHPVADISTGSAPTMIEMLYPADRYLYFAATTTSSGRELWRTDGTAGGTALVIDVNPGAANGINFDWNNPWKFLELNGLLYFYASDASSTSHLYRTDGSAAGTVLLAQLAPDIYSNRINFYVAGGKLFIVPSSYQAEQELWTSDGTPTGTFKLKDIYPGTTGSSPDGLTEFKGRLFFSATSPDTGRELWVSDGTSAGTTLFADINPGSASSSLSRPVLVGDQLIFTATDGVHGSEMWKTDGTAAGTALITDINPGTPGSLSVTHNFAAQTLGNALIFIAYTPDAKEQFWRTDGTAAGTYLLTNFSAAFGFDSNSKGYFMGRTPGHLYYAFGSVPYGSEIWETDGTVAGTKLVADLNPGAGTSYPDGIITLGEIGVLGIDTPAYGRKLWRVADDSSVITRSLFYNNRAFDGPGSSPQSADDGAIASDKSALRPGQQATFANVSSYVKGINGVMIDLRALPSGTGPTLSDFGIEVSTDGAVWANGPSPTISLRRGAGAQSADRISLAWPDNSIVNKWLRVTVQPTVATGLSAADVFYFGSAVGETGNTVAGATSLTVDSADYYGVRDHLRSYDNPAPTDWKWDFNRDGVTDLTDIMIVRSASTTGTALQLILAPQIAAAAAVAPIESKTVASTMTLTTTITTTKSPRPVFSRRKISTALRIPTAYSWSTARPIMPRG